MIEVKKLSYSIPEKELYQKVSFAIEENKHYAFIGTNGTGKSTLLQMLLNAEEYLYTGEISYSEAYRNSRIGYVSQFSAENVDPEQTVFDYISREFKELDQEIEVLCEKMGTEADLDAVFAEYQDALDRKEAIDGDHYEINIRKQLKLAEIENLEQHTLGQLSGGEFKLIQVIREMLLSPKMLFMDEPDVFLDFDHVNALVELINAHKGTLVVITHNRYLLNHCFDRILHLEGTEIQTFEGSYAAYNLNLLTTKMELQEIVAKEEEEIARQQVIVNKMRAHATYMDNASLGSRVHARQTLLDRLEARKTSLPFVEIKRPALFLENACPLEDPEQPLLTLKGYEAAFDDELLTDIDLQILPTDKVAIVGKNGTGKTTLLRDVWEHSLDSIALHPEARLAMFSQVIGGALDADKTLTQVLEENGMETPAEIQEYLQSYGFTSEEAEKRVGQLSGGEKDLFQLAVLSRKKANFLLLDEPTGHLDLYAQVALEKAIKSYTGGVLMVSHDFYIVANCMDYVLLVEDNQIRRMSIRKFRQMIYQNHFDKDYLLLEDQKKDLEMRVEKLLEKRDFAKAKELLVQLEELVQRMHA